MPMFDFGDEADGENGSERSRTENLLAVSSGFPMVFSQRRAAAGRNRVSSTINPRCDAARSPHPAHIHLHLPAHSRSSDLRQYQVSSKTISARARGDARVAASGRVSGVRRPSSFGPGYPGSPPSDWAGSARTIVDAEDDAASFPSWTSPVARFAASERVYILGMPAHTALSGGNGRPGKRPNQSSLFLAVPADSPFPAHPTETTPN